jgi:hypothetical protein
LLGFTKKKIPFLGNTVLRICVAGVLLCLAVPIRSQPADSTIPDTSRTFTVHKHSPRAAVILSMAIPGLGQVYNHKYWKVPIIYGAGGAFAYFAGFNQLKYKKFRRALVDTPVGSQALIDGQYYPQEVLANGENYYRRYRDISVFGVGLIYFLNIIDAMVDAQFYYFDVSDNLALRIRPTMNTGPGLMASMGIGITIRF